MIKKKNKTNHYFESSKKNVFVGNRYLCIKDVLMTLDNKIAFKEGKIYTSEAHDCLTSEDGDANHMVSGFGNNSFLFEYFKLMIVP